MPKSNKKLREVYLDHASSALADSANPGAIHELGVREKNKLENARKNVAEVLGAHSDEIVFTSGATESNNLAILGTQKKCLEIFFHCALPRVRVGTLADKKFQDAFFVTHIITTNIEHASVLGVCKYLEKTKQAEITYVPVEKNGIVDPKKIKKALKPNTILVSVMYANNEIGTIQPIQEIAKELRHFRKKAKFSQIFSRCALKSIPGLDKSKPGMDFPLFHTDATQAINYLPINVEKLGIDLMSFNGAKIYGPKGVGVLYIKRKTLISPIMFGGNQEFGLRPGTENVAGAVTLAEALKTTEKIKEKESKRLTKLRDYFIKKLFDLQKQNRKFSRVLGLGPDQLENFDFVFTINGDLKNRLPNNVNITIPKIPSDLLVLELSARGIYVSEKSACKSGDKAGSYVIEALGKKDEGSLRFSLGRQTTKADIDYTIKNLSEILKKLKKWYT